MPRPRKWQYCGGNRPFLIAFKRRRACSMRRRNQQHGEIKRPQLLCVAGAVLLVEMKKPRAERRSRAEESRLTERIAFFFCWRPKSCQRRDKRWRHENAGGRCCGISGPKIPLTARRVAPGNKLPRLRRPFIGSGREASRQKCRYKRRRE